MDSRAWSNTFRHRDSIYSLAGDPEPDFDLGHIWLYFDASSCSVWCRILEDLVDGKYDTAYQQVVPTFTSSPAGIRRRCTTLKMTWLWRERSIDNEIFIATIL